MIKENASREHILTELRNLNDIEETKQGNNEREYFEEVQTVRILKSMELIRSGILSGEFKAETINWEEYGIKLAIERRLYSLPNNAKEEILNQKKKRLVRMGIIKNYWSILNTFHKSQ